METYLAMIIAKPADIFDGIKVNLKRKQTYGCGRNNHFTKNE